MDTIGDLLQKIPGPKPEIEIIKNYVFKKYGQKINVITRENNFIIICNSAALANNLRMELLKIQELFDSNATLSVRIGQV